VKKEARKANPGRASASRNGGREAKRFCLRSRSERQRDCRVVRPIEVDERELQMSRTFVGVERGVCLG
jgi:hypothetical protein